MSIPKVKHIELSCPKTNCKFFGFVQAVIVDDPEKQEKIDQLAYEKIRDTLVKQHKDGLHE